MQYGVISIICTSGEIETEAPASLSNVPVLNFSGSKSI